MDITPATLDAFNRTIDMRFRQGFDALPTYWQQVATEVPSSSKGNIYPWLAKIPGMREWLGARVVNNLSAKFYELTNKHWEDTVAVERDNLADDTFGFYGDIFGMLGGEAKEWIDVELARVIEAGTTALCWDGQFFFDTDHPVDPDGLVSGTNSNKLVGAGYDLAVADPLVPYAAAKAAMMTWKREDGRQMGTIGDTIMCHPNEERYARQVANAVMTAQAVGSAAAGVTNVFAGECNVIVNPHLTVTSGKPWYLLATKRPIKPFLWQNRQAAELVARTNLTDSNVFYNKQFEWGCDLRGAAGYTFPFLAFRMSAS